MVYRVPQKQLNNLATYRNNNNSSQKTTTAAKGNGPQPRDVASTGGRLWSVNKYLTVGTVATVFLSGLATALGDKRSVAFHLKSTRPTYLPPSPAPTGPTTPPPAFYSAGEPVVTSVPFTGLTEAPDWATTSPLAHLAQDIRTTTKQLLSQPGLYPEVSMRAYAIRPSKLQTLNSTFAASVPTSEAASLSDYAERTTQTIGVSDEASELWAEVGELQQPGSVGQALASKIETLRETFEGLSQNVTDTKLDQYAQTLTNVTALGDAVDAAGKRYPNEVTSYDLQAFVINAAVADMKAAPAFLLLEYAGFGAGNVKLVLHETLVASLVQNEPAFSLLSANTGKQLIAYVSDATQEAKVARNWLTSLIYDPAWAQATDPQRAVFLENGLRQRIGMPIALDDVPPGGFGYASYFSNYFYGRDNRFSGVAQLSGVGSSAAAQNFSIDIGSSGLAVDDSGFLLNAVQNVVSVFPPGALSSVGVTGVTFTNGSTAVDSDALVLSLPQIGGGQFPSDAQLDVARGAAVEAVTQALTSKVFNTSSLVVDGEWASFVLADAAKTPYGAVSQVAQGSPQASFQQAAKLTLQSVGTDAEAGTKRLFPNQLGALKQVFYSNE